MNRTEAKWRPRNVKVDLARTLAGGIGTLLALILSGWPENAAVGALVGLGGLIAGYLLAIGVEYVLRLRGEVHRLQGIEQQLATEQEARERERGLRDYQVMIAKREAALGEIGTKVWGGAFNELAKKHPGDALPVSALMARQEVMVKAQGLDKPPPPENLSDGVGI